jgi:hypothetical protein
MRGRRKGKAYCFKWRLSGKDAPYGDHVCVDWEKRANARVPKNRGANETQEAQAPMLQADD